MFTVSQYGAYGFPPDMQFQQGFDGLDNVKTALGGDDEIVKAEDRWREHFDLEPKQPKRFIPADGFDPAPLKYGGLASGMRFESKTLSIEGVWWG
jgi:hypothetical protein